MGVLDDIMQDDAAVFMDPDAFGEPTTYTPVGGDPISNVSVVVEREGPQQEAETADGVRFELRVFVPRDPNGLSGPATCRVNDSMTLRRMPDEDAETFRVVKVVDGDAGGWQVLVV